MSGFEEIRCLDAPLAEKLAAYADQLPDTEPEFARVYSVFVDRLLASGAGSQAPEVGTALPAFLLPDNDGRLVGSAELLAAGPLVVSFNRGHWCAFCRLELLALAEIYPEVKRLGGELVSIMPELGAPVRRLRETYDIPFPVLTDIDNGYALTCGLMVSLGDAVRDVYLSVGRDLAQFQGNDGWFVPIPATFVIASDGRICDRFVDPDFGHRIARISSPDARTRTNPRPAGGE
jgi:peroxiredoxin